MLILLTTSANRASGPTAGRGSPGWWEPSNHHAARRDYGWKAQFTSGERQGREPAQCNAKSASHHLQLTPGAHSKGLKTERSCERLARSLHRSVYVP